MAKLVNLSGKWAAPIGRLFIAFGGIEKILLDCLLFFPRDPIYRHAARQSLRSKIDLLTEILEPRTKSSDEIKKLVELLNQTKLLSEKRNLIAHNPLMLQVAEDPNDSAPLHECIISARKGGKVISFEELEKIVDEAESIESMLHKFILNLRTRTNHITAATR